MSSSKRILVVEDEPTIRHAVTYAFRKDGFDVHEVDDLDDALAALGRRPDLVILDLVLPRSAGTEALRRLRAVSSVPIIVLTELDSELDRVVGFELGADDYVTKPFSVRELVSRVRALLRRREMDSAERSSLLEVGGLRINLARHEVWIDEQPVELTGSEFKLLALLSESPGQIVARRDIIHCLWNGNHAGADHACDVHVSNLRHKIERNPRRPERLLTVRGLGYKLVAV